jgi:hypothetical protein
MIDECKKNSKNSSKAFIVVRGSMLVYKIITLEGRRFRIKEKVFFLIFNLFINIILIRMVPILIVPLSYS